MSNLSRGALIQINSMRIHFPHFKFSNRGGNLIFKGTLQPSKEMPIYTVSIEYRENSMPKVKVLDPPLVEEPPHYYHKADCLCLYKPDNFKWTATKPMSNYIVSWTACWLYFYEVWKEKKVWLGPEANHDRNKEQQS
jgi:hypothetical protein